LNGLIPYISTFVLLYNPISIKDFVRAKKSATEKRKSKRNFLIFINEIEHQSPNLLNLNADWLMGERGGAGWLTHARHGYPHLVIYKVKPSNHYFNVW
jgi:hypothetical protein